MVSHSMSRLWMKKKTIELVEFIDRQSGTIFFISISDSAMRYESVIGNDDAAKVFLNE